MRDADLARFADDIGTAMEGTVTPLDTDYERFPRFDEEWDINFQAIADRLADMGYRKATK